MPVVNTNLYGPVTFLDLQAQAPMREVLEWKTDVLAARSGLEERWALRPRPRQQFRQSVPIPGGRVQAAFNLVYGRLGQLWGIPVWSEAQSIGNVSSSQTVITCDTTLRDLRPSSLALLWASTGWAIVEIQSLTALNVTLPVAVGKDLTGAWIIPLRVGRLGTPVERDGDGYSATLAMNFEVEDNIDLAPTAPAQYLGDDIYYDENLLGSGGTIATDLVGNITEVDYELGLFKKFDLWLNRNNRVRRPYNAVLATPLEQWTFRKWLHRRMGRHRAFWQPSFDNDVRLKQSGTLGASLQSWADDRFNGALKRTHIAVQTLDGVWYPRTVSSTTAVDSDTVQLNLDSPLNIPAANVSRISYLGLKRLDTDRVELNWKGGICTTTVNTLELTP